MKIFKYFSMAAIVAVALVFASCGGSGKSDNESDSYSSSSSSSQDWDALLDSYEQYADEYVSLVKKAANGDASAMSEYPSLLQKAQEYGEKLENAEGDMSASQLSRYTQITNKMSQAAQDLR